MTAEIFSMPKPKPGESLTDAIARRDRENEADARAVIDKLLADTRATAESWRAVAGLGNAFPPGVRERAARLAESMDTEADTIAAIAGRKRR